MLNQHDFLQTLKKIHGARRSMEWYRWVHSGTRTGALKKPCLAAWVQRTDCFHGKSQDFPWWLGVPHDLGTIPGRIAVFDQQIMMMERFWVTPILVSGFRLVPFHWFCFPKPLGLHIHLHFQRPHLTMLKWCVPTSEAWFRLRTHQLLQTLPPNIKYTPENLGVNMIRFMSGAQS